MAKPKNAKRSAKKRKEAQKQKAEILKTGVQKTVGKPKTQKGTQRSVRKKGEILKRGVLKKWSAKMEAQKS